MGFFFTTWATVGFSRPLLCECSGQIVMRFTCWEHFGSPGACYTPQIKSSHMMQSPASKHMQYLCSPDVGTCSTRRAAALCDGWPWRRCVKCLWAWAAIRSEFWATFFISLFSFMKQEQSNGRSPCVCVCVTSVEVFGLQLTQYERCTVGAHPSVVLRDFIQSAINRQPASLWGGSATAPLADLVCEVRQCSSCWESVQLLWK